MSAMTAPLLAVESLDAHHGMLPAVRGVSLSLGEGDKLALVGANGAGKTTLLRAIAGAHPVASGRVWLAGADVTALPAHRRVALGIALVPEGRRLFPDMTVLENLLVAGRRARPGPWTVDAVLDAFPLLRPLRDRRCAALSGGEQQATAIARALMTNPRVLLLDEVSLGLAPVAVDAVYASLGQLLATGTTIILVEQDLGRAMRVADRVVCLLEGRIVLECPAAGLTRERVTEAYFGLRGPDVAAAP
jgi:branched-chain amino acid transport system ATP-binding protein